MKYCSTFWTELSSVLYEFLNAMSLKLEMEVNKMLYKLILSFVKCCVSYTIYLFISLIL